MYDCEGLMGWFLNWYLIWLMTCDALLNCTYCNVIKVACLHIMHYILLELEDTFTHYILYGSECTLSHYILYKSEYTYAHYIFYYEKSGTLVQFMNLASPPIYESQLDIQSSKCGHNICITFIHSFLLLKLYLMNMCLL